jgi:rSAM/selenodomain-associated transferase 2
VLLTQETFSVIVPVRPDEEAWVDLLHDLQTMPAGTEVLLTGPKAPKGFAETQSTPLAKRLQLSWISSPLGRARQQNVAVSVAKGKVLWFLHADSRFSPGAVAGLMSSIKKYPNDLLFFNLAFLRDGPALMAINKWGAYIRSRLLGIPFGDQGFAMKREVFDRVGGFSEATKLGEDHQLVWEAAHAGVNLRCTGSTIYTSARKYRSQGWLKTTLRHLYLTYKLALKEAIRLNAKRVKAGSL